MGDEVALKVADLLGLEGGYVLACIAAERSKDDKVKKAWAWWADHRLAAAFAVVAVAAGMLLPGMNADSLSGAALLGFASIKPGLYIMSNLQAAKLAATAIIATLCTLAFPHLSRQNPRPEKEPVKLSR